MSGAPKPERVKELAEMLNGLDGEAREKLLANIAREEPLVAIELEKALFTFAHLAKVEDAVMQQALRGMDTAVLALALRQCDDGVRDKILNNMTVRTANAVREEIKASGPRRMSEVQEAQAEITAAVKRALS